MYLHFQREIKDGFIIMTRLCSQKLHQRATTDCTSTIFFLYTYLHPVNKAVLTLCVRVCKSTPLTLNINHIVLFSEETPEIMIQI